MLLPLSRILKFSFQDITRNIWLSLVTVSILVLAIFSINLLLAVKVISQSAITAVKEKVDISLYIKPAAEDSKIAALRGQVSALDNVGSVRYITKQQALESFREKNQNNQEVLDALKELDYNPLSPSLVITPTDPDKTPDLIESLKRLNSDIIESRDFSDNSLILSKIDGVTGKINEIGLIIISIFVFTSLLVVYNSIRIAIYTHRREIEIMRLVGASNMYIYLPFIISSLIYTLLSGVIVIILLFPFLGILQPYLQSFFGGSGINIIDYFLNNGLIIFGGELGAVALINACASWLAIRKYARV
jgi:cell division transport system permease protein